MNDRNTENLSDKVFFRFLASSVSAIVICLICLCSSTYAWFSVGIRSNSNKITAGQCLLTASVSSDEGELLLTGTAMLEDDRTVLLSGGAVYTVTLTLPKDSASGYLVFTTGTGESAKNYYSDSIARHAEDSPKTIQFTLTVASDTTVTITPRWGIYSGTPDVKDGGTLHIQ